jgi:hypothetical protein
MESHLKSFPATRLPEYLLAPEHEKFDRDRTAKRQKKIAVPQPRNGDKTLRLKRRTHASGLEPALDPGRRSGL